MTRSIPSNRVPSISALLLLALLLRMAVAPAPAAATIINNGLAPPEPANVLDGPYAYLVDVRNQGCYGVDPCLGPPATTVLLVDGGAVSQVDARDSSRFETEGGVVESEVHLFHQAHLDMRGGQIGPLVSEELWVLVLHDAATARIAGGIVGQPVVLWDDAHLVMEAGEVRTDVRVYGANSRFEMTGGRVGRTTRGPVTDAISAANGGEISFSGDAQRAQRERTKRLLGGDLRRTG